MMSSGTYWDIAAVDSRDRRKEFGKPQEMLERSPGHHEEFFMACRGEKPREFSQSNYSLRRPDDGQHPARSTSVPAPARSSN